MFLLHGLKTPDLVFFIICGVVIILIVVIYFLIPVFKRKEYQEARENLKKREELFHANRKQEAPEAISVKESPDKEKLAEDLGENE